MENKSFSPQLIVVWHPIWWQTLEHVLMTSAEKPQYPLKIADISIWRTVELERVSKSIFLKIHSNYNSLHYSLRKRLLCHQWIFIHVPAALHVQPAILFLDLCSAGLASISYLLNNVNQLTVCFFQVCWLTLTCLCKCSNLHLLCHLPYLWKIKLSHGMLKGFYFSNAAEYVKMIVCQLLRFPQRTFLLLTDPCCYSYCFSNRDKQKYAK